MESISLIVPFGSAGALADDDLVAYRRVLDEQDSGFPVEVILAGELDDRRSLREAVPPLMVPTSGEGPGRGASRGDRGRVG